MLLDLGQEVFNFQFGEEREVEQCIRFADEPQDFGEA